MMKLLAGVEEVSESTEPTEKQPEEAEKQRNNNHEKQQPTTEFEETLKLITGEVNWLFSGRFATS